MSSAAATLLLLARPAAAHPRATATAAAYPTPVLQKGSIQMVKIDFYVRLNQPTAGKCLQK